ncbi:radical SAM family heme chaperone HemW [Solitalea canadensis]|uniref:Heme chaperone HemW n=1 Tax=Solitalea canadensis (strain ATCC 29591 / DSM 3403 / JCM 21819 / LMG 8368 / NBRC 15130 / NCIMB 12057 / USAM 9D) TaxID=929556 RepID=H8KX09_SOLCM|nr:radical SAM family heme chaperone HemW [Solitalea canadensis]AFD08338.1 putative oxygen-independent coproporphyrinogen III oxidase [Solitalea canadensis DSM 3403]
MAGIYIHIPFCKKACYYCDFHFSTNWKVKTELLAAIEQELELQRNYLNGESVETVYFGGGTPSILTGEEINAILDKINTLHHVAASAEITLEANPDDLDAAKIKELRQTAVNRFSIGIQSFFDEDLQWMNRAHNASEAKSSIMRAQDAGFENITCDLIYGYPLLTNKKWKENIQTLIDLQIPHISSYSMTVEPQTALASFIRKNKQQPMNEEQSAEQFQYLIEELSKANFLHYEISNFGKEGWLSKHNSNYWFGKKYLGIGPSAHSFNGETRQWNIANNYKYIDSLSQKKIPFEEELLSPVQRLNEYVMTALRTMWGIDLKKIENNYGKEFLEEIMHTAEKYIDKQWVTNNEDKLILSKEGKLYADLIASELFIT